MMREGIPKSNTTFDPGYPAHNAPRTSKTQVYLDKHGTYVV